MTMMQQTGTTRGAAKPWRSRSRGMSLWEAVLVALQGLLANKLRSILTMLGIIIGVASVILTVSLGQGASEQSQDIIRKMGTNVLTLMPNFQRTGAINNGIGSLQNLKEEDSAAILNECPDVGAVAPEYTGRLRVKYLNQNTSTTVVGTTPEHFDIRNVKMADGRIFTKADNEQRARVCVVGDAVRDAVFGDNVQPVGKVVKIRGINFEVVGVAAYKGAAGFNNPDDQVWVPLTTAMYRLFGAKYLQRISIQATNEKTMDKAQTEVEQLMMRRHHQQPYDQPDVRIFNQADLAETAQQQSDMLTKLLTGIAAVSLLVGGIGIMNIMLVSVTERTREIGIRKAIGARWLDILNQFLIESVTMSLVGGLMGIGLGIGGSLALKNYVGWATMLTLPPILMAFGFAAVIGIFFGIYPAMKAARLNPIEALRYE
jgi:putative ABC transport system permease protein